MIAIMINLNLYYDCRFALKLGVKDLLLPVFEAQCLNRMNRGSEEIRVNAY